MKHKRPISLDKIILSILLVIMLPYITLAQQSWNPNHSIGTVSAKYSFSYSQTPDQLVELYSAAIPNNTGCSYQWQQSSSPVFTTYSNATGTSNLASYTFSGPLTQTTYYRRITTNASIGAALYSNIVKISVVSANWEDLNYIREHDVLVTGKTTWTSVDQLAIGQKLQTTVYLDGLDRPIQSLNTGTATPATGSSTWGDKVSFNVYDNYGLQPTKYLGYTTTTNVGKYKTANNTEQPQYYTSVYNETAAYNTITFDNSPLDRAVNIKDPGTSWAASAGNSAAYEANTTAENVQIFSVDYVRGDAPINKGPYMANSLFKTTYTDENGKKVIEYHDKAGKIVLKKTQVADAPSVAHSGWICLYYVYDDFGLMRFQLQPEAVSYLDANGWSFSGTAGQQVLSEMCFQYDYDEKGHTIWKKVPGASPLQMIYDNRDRVVFLQDGNQAAMSTPQWTTNLYDNLDRLTITALYNTTESVSALQTDIANATTTSVTVTNPSAPVLDLVIDSRNTAISSYTAQNSIVFTSDDGGSFSSVPSDNFTAQISSTASTSATTSSVTVYGNPISLANLNNSTVTTIVKYLFYDDYSYAGVKGFSNNFNNTQAYSTSDANVIAISSSKRTLNLVTGSKVRVLGTNTFLLSTEYYDEKGRHIQTLEDNILQGQDITTSQYYFDGRLLSSSSKHYTPNSGYINFSVLSKYVFDKIGRVTSIQKQYAENAFKTVVSYDYDDVGRVKVKHLDPGYTGSGKTEMEALAYSYNIHGQITGINKDYALKGSAYSKWGNFFGLYLGYDNKDGAFTASQLDGHVTGLMWSTQGDDVQRKYDYTYDNAGRLTSALFKEKQNPADAWSNSKMDFSVSGNSGKITYDLNGNLLNMVQKGVLPGVAAPVQVDNLTYSYQSHSNKLSYVTDNGTAGTSNGLQGDFKDGTNTAGTPDYVYDANGNLIVDLNKVVGSIVSGVSTPGITYNYLDKPTQVVLTGKGTINIVYDADGTRLKKTFTPVSGTAVTTSYVNEYVYQGNTLQYINFEEGRIRIVQPVSQGNGYDALTITGNMNLPNNAQGAYDFYVRDYQQNVRMILTEEVHTGSNMCSMETSRASTEDAIFQGSGNEVENTRVPITTITGQSSGGGWHSNTSASVSQVGNYSGAFAMGSNVLLKVMAGDVINASAPYYYAASGSYTAGTAGLTQNVLTSLINALGGNATSAVVKSGSSSIQSALTGTPSFGNITDPGSAGTAAAGAPQAYLTVVFFDERFNYIGTGSQWQQVSQAGDGATPLVLANVQAPKNGYAFVYVSNKATQPVYFDNVQVGLTHGRIMEEDHYYAYGLKIAAISSTVIADPHEGYVTNKNLYNDKELDDDGGLNWYDYGFRNYDPQIGRFVQIDPMADYFGELSPYLYAYDDPIANVDEYGLDGVSSVGEAAAGTQWLANVTVHAVSHVVKPAVQATSWWDRVAKAAKVVGSFVKGVGNSALETVKGVGNMVLHPINTVTAIVHIVADPVKAGKALISAVKQTYHAFKNGNAQQRAEILGKLTGDVAQMFIGSGEVKAAEELGDVARVTGEAEKIEKVTQEVNEANKLTKFKSPCGCFLPGTLVLTDSGYIKIENIKVGMKVWAYNDTTRQFNLKKVNHVFEHVRDTIYKIYIGNDIINTTSDHPFFIGGKWMRVKDIHKGDSVLSYSLTKLVIDSIKIIVKHVIVHNFEVADFHTYYVSGSKVLVHNNGPCDVDMSKYGQAKGLKGEEGVYEHFFENEAGDVKSYSGQTKDLGGARPKKSLRERRRMAEAEGYKYKGSNLTPLKGSGHSTLNSLERATLKKNGGIGSSTYNLNNIPK